MGATALQLQCTAVQGRGQTTKLQCGSLEFGKRALGVSALVSAPQCMWPYTLAHSGCGPGIGPTLSSGGGACESGRDTGTIGIKLSSSHWHWPDLHFHSFSPILPFSAHFSFHFFISHPQTALVFHNFLLESTLVLQCSTSMKFYWLSTDSPPSVCLARVHI